MSRKISYEITMSISISESDLALLAYVSSRTSRGTSVSMTMKALSRGAKTSVATARRASRNLENKGLLVVRDVRRSDGGYDANLYSLTELGYLLLESKGSMHPRRVNMRKPKDEGNAGDEGATDVDDGVPMSS